MVERNSKSKKFIDNLLNFQDVKDLELCDDQGVKVSTHTYDVLNISINKIKEKYSSTWGELGIGIQIPVTNSAYVYTDLRYERSFKSNPKHNGYRGTVGLKYTF